MKMNLAIASIAATATGLRLLLSFVIFPSNTPIDDGNPVVVRALGPGILPAMGAAISDPTHSWDHLEEACFWLENGPSSWTDPRDGSDGNAVGDVGYDSIYVPGTRVVAPPLVVAFLGETMVCTGSVTFRRLIQNLLLLIADSIGAFCLYHLGKRIFAMESRSNEEEIERHTQREGRGGDDLVVPGILRPQRDWVFGLSSKIISPDESLTDEGLNGASTVKGKKENGINKGGSSIPVDIATSPSPDRDPIITLDQLPIASAVSYYCNPISMLANATGSMRSLWDSLLLLSFYYATMPPAGTTKEGIPIKIPSATKVSFALALATYADVGYGMFILPILIWRGLLQGAQTQTSNKRGRHQDWEVVLMLYILYLGGMHFFASLLVGGDFSTYTKVMVQTMLPNIAFVQQDGSGSLPGPSMGLHWYMFVQVFDRFRPYFTVFVSGIPMMFPIPLTTRLYRYPSVLAATFQLLWAIFRPTTTVHTLTLGLHLAALSPRTIARMRDPSLISFFALPVPILLFVTFHRMWLVTGNGNPNYIYFQCFAYGMFVTTITMDFVSATVKRDKVRRMIEKGSIKTLLAKKMKGDKQDKDGDQSDSQKKGENGSLKEGENGSLKEGEKVETHSGNGEKIALEASGEIEDQDKPAPVVVFL